MMYHYDVFGEITSEDTFKQALNRIKITDVQQFLKQQLNEKYIFKFNG